MQKHILITIEGNIGSGKSTMINRIKEQYPQYKVIDEPVGQWMDMKDTEGKSLLQLFYEDKNRWSYTFQNAAFITRYLSAYEAMIKETEPTIFISERGILTDRYVFATMLKNDGFLNTIEWDLYTRWFDHFKNLVSVQGIVYITTNSDTCKDRIKIRNRQGEESIPLDYLRELDEYHEKWIQNSDIPVLRITSDASELIKIVDFVESFRA